MPPSPGSCPALCLDAPTGQGGFISCSLRLFLSFHWSWHFRVSPSNTAHSQGNQRLSQCTCQFMGGLVPFSQLWKVTLASLSEIIADASSTDKPTASPVLSATQESDHGLPLVHHSWFLWNSNLAPHLPSHLLFLLSFLSGFRAGLYFLDVLTSHSIIKHRTHGGPFLQAGADLWDFRPKVMWVFSHV